MTSAIEPIVNEFVTQLQGAVDRAVRERLQAMADGLNGHAKAEAAPRRPGLLSKAERSRIATLAAKRRWARVRKAKA